MWRILIADDDPAAQKILVNILKGKAECTVTKDGLEALNAYRDAKKRGAGFDAIVLDVQMPEMDGVTVLRLIRDEEEQANVIFGQGIPIIVLTVYDEYFTKMFNLKCDDFLVKPVVADVLLKKLSEKIDSRKPIG